MGVGGTRAMDAKDIDFLKRLKATFRGEAEEHIQAISAGLIELEKSPTPERGIQLMESIFRESHSLKGAARSVSLKNIESICQPLEGAFSALKRGSIPLSSSVFDLLHRSVDAIARIVSSVDMEGSSSDRAASRELIRALVTASAGVALPMKSAEEPYRLRPASEEKPISASTVRIPMERLDLLLLQAEELVAIKLTASQRSAELREIDRTLQSWKDQEPKARVGALKTQVATVTRALEQDQRSIKRMVDEHLEEMKRAVMLPVASLVEGFPKIVRDLARDQGKEAELIIRGAEIEIDKRILEEMKDPLVHLLRNCVDHGMQSPEKRIAQDKAPHGTITIAFAAKDGRQAEILVSDDGAGIDLAQVRAAAAKSGILSREAVAKLDQEEALALIYQSGISTSPTITNISGRGLGLAIVREKVEKLGGSVSVDTRVGAGTTFRILLPLTLATFRGVVVRIDDALFILPTLNVEHATRVDPAGIKTVENREMIQVDGENLSMVALADALGMPHRAKKAPSPARTSEGATEPLPIVVLAHADTRIAFQVDEILDEQQVMLKGLGKQLRRVRNVAGAAILGSSRVVPVLNVSDLMKSALRNVVPSRSAADLEDTPSKRARVLVAEDSITSRSLLKNILETAGYDVTTAVDGTDAYSKIVESEFDLIVSDVDMPRMSGFELTAKIRGDKRFSQMPVVLVTALESREDRERGIDAGADAYIVKSSFDQSNLLEVVQRLV